MYDKLRLGDIISAGKVYIENYNIKKATEFKEIFSEYVSIIDDEAQKDIEALMKKISDDINEITIDNIKDIEISENNYKNSKVYKESREAYKKSQKTGLFTSESKRKRYEVKYNSAKSTLRKCCGLIIEEMKNKNELEITNLYNKYFSQYNQIKNNSNQRIEANAEILYSFRQETILYKINSTLKGKNNGEPIEYTVFNNTNGEFQEFLNVHEMEFLTKKIEDWCILNAKNLFILNYNTGYEFGKRQGYKIGYNQGHDDGYSEGYCRGHVEGYDEGYYIGHDGGYDEGYTIGHDEGYDEGYSKCYDEGYD